jgi:hypothetical protein
MNYLKSIKNNFRLLLFLFLLVFSIISSMLIMNVANRHVYDHHLSILAAQFAKLHTAIPPLDVPFGDVVNYKSTYYLYFGPLSSMILAPFTIFFGKNFPQVLLGIGSMISSFLIVFSISKIFKFNRVDALWISLFFVFSTVLFGIGIINISAYQVQVLGIPFILLGLREYFSKKRPLLIGIFIALAVLTRVTFVLSIVFFFVEFIYKRLSFKAFVLILIPLVFVGIILGAYNYRRFHSFTETGYALNTTLKSYPMSSNIKTGFFSIAHVPANIYSFLIMPPEPVLKGGGGFVLEFPYLKVSPWGMAVWYTSPLFLLFLFKFKKGKYTTPSLLTIIALAIPSFTYFGIGYSQYGYRYASDFLPFLLILLYPLLSTKLSRTAITLITIGVLFNCIFLASLWDSYPLFGIIK